MKNVISQIAFLLFLISFILLKFSVLETKNSNEDQEQYIQKIADKVFDELKDNHKILLNKDQFKGGFAIVENNRLIKWSTNSGIPKTIFRFNSGHSFHLEKNNLFFIYTSIQNDKKYVHWKKFVIDSEQNHELRHLSALSLRAYRNCYTISASGNSSIFYRLKNSATSNLWIYHFLVVVILISWLAFFLSGFFNSSKINQLTWFLLLLAMRLSLFFLLPKPVLSGLNLFNPSVFASSQLVPSFGDLVLHTLVVIAGLFFIVKNVSASVLNKNIFQFLLLLMLVFIGDLIIKLIENLVINSTVAMSTVDISKLNLFSFLFIFYAISLFFIYFYLFLKGLNLTRKNDFVICILAFVVFALFQLIDASYRFSQFVFPLLVFVISIFLKRLKTKQYLYFVYLGISVLLTAVAIEIGTKKKEKEHINLLSSKVLNVKDVKAEEILLEIENKIALDLQHQDSGKTSQGLDFKLKNLYFTGYLDNFLTSIYSFTPEEKNNPKRIELEKLYNYKSTPTQSNYFFQLQEQSSNPSYIARYENCYYHNKSSDIFILLKPRLLEKSGQFYAGEKQDLIEKYLENKYSYGIYYKGELSRFKGDFSYPITLKNLENNNKEWKHFWYFHGLHYTVVLSRKNLQLSHFFSLVSFLAISVSLLILLAFLLVRLVNGSLFAISPLIRTKIQLAIFGILFGSFLLFAIFQINYLQESQDERQKIELKNKLKQIINQFEVKYTTSAQFNKPEERQLLINNLSDANLSDINLYHENGQLLNSTYKNTSGNQIFMIPYSVYQSFVNKNQSIAVGKFSNDGVNNLSGYISLRGFQKELPYIINVPFYKSQTEIYYQMSEAVNRILMILLLLLISALLIAFLVSGQITKPLKIIKNSMSAVQLMKKNELIEYSSTDEIGDLIKEYNGLVLELEESANKLSQTEKEAAWKEMAKQVAHEIKNPLTPIKLSLQHLQRAWDSNHPQLDELFQKVSQTVLTQIDSLSKLATEFSEFAKMPVENYEVFNLSELLLNAIHLFEKSSKVKFIYDKKWPPIIVNGDKEQLGRVFNNIIKNALQAMQDTPKPILNISYLEKQNNYIELIFSDNGSGMDEQTKKRVFEPNFSTKSSGMGLGLAISRKIIENMNGFIRFESTLKKGTTFFIELHLFNDEKSNER